ncbi:MAG: nitroreductase/quinone reductase family protein, partial [Propionibacteriaceae bacterium]
MTLPRGYLTGTAIALALAWVPYALSPGSGLVAPVAQTVIYLGLAVLTARSRRLKILLVRTVQRWVINPVVRSLFAVGLNPLGLVILETRGRVSGRPRRTPVGNGRMGDSLWIIAEHGSTANYVRNILHDPRVRVRIRQGMRYRWVTGVATVLPDDDPLAQHPQRTRPDAPGHPRHHRGSRRATLHPHRRPEDHSDRPRAARASPVLRLHHPPSTDHCQHRTAQSITGLVVTRPHHADSGFRRSAPRSRSPCAHLPRKSGPAAGCCASTR